MQLNGIIKKAPAGQNGFDSACKINSEILEALTNKDFKFCIRYLTLGPYQNTNMDLSYEEAELILNHGLALFAVQHAPAPNWDLYDPISQGNEYGTQAAQNAKSIGLPPGMNIWCDLEGLLDGISASQVETYCKHWYDSVLALGYVPGIYIGYDTYLSSSDLYHKLPFQHYWKGMSSVPPVEHRGYQLVQHYPSESLELPCSGDPNQQFQFDTNTTQTDHKGGQVIWLAPD